MAEPAEPLETADDKHEYGAYLFFLYLTKFYNTDQIILTIWNNTAQYGSLKAVDRAIPGGFEEQWPLFAGCLWNKPPADCFARWDHLEQNVADSVAPRNLDMGAATISHTLELTGISIEHMAASYQRFVITDDAVRSVVFNNTLAGVPHAAVQALAKINGEWQEPSDWTGRATNVFCRDIAAQHIEELVIIISNSDWENKGKLLPPEPPTLTARTSGCPDWVGTASAVVHRESAIYTITVSGLRFQMIAGGDANPPYVDYTLTSSQAATWHVSGTVQIGYQDCSVTGEMPMQPADGTDGSNGVISGYLSTNLDEHTYGIRIGGWDTNAIERTTCPDGYTHEDQFSYPCILWTANHNDLVVTEDGRLDGVYVDPKEYLGGRWQWHFDPAPPE